MGTIRNRFPQLVRERRRGGALALASLLVGAASSAQQPMPAFQPTKLFESAAHVAVLEATADEVPVMQASPGGEPDTWTLPVRLVRTLQGPALPPAFDLTLTSLIRPFAGGPLHAGDTVIAFVVTDPSRGIKFLSDPGHGLMRVSWTRAAAASAQPRELALAELRQALSDPDPGVQFGALRALTEFVDARALERAQALSRSSDVRVAIAALELRLALGDASALAPVIQLIERDERPSAGQRDILAWAITRSAATPPVADLNRILVETPHAGLATAAAYLLAQSGDMTSLAAFRAGLERPELETRYRCVVGLCRLSGSPGPGHREFMANPAPTVSHWAGRLDRRLGR